MVNIVSPADVANSGSNSTNMNNFNAVETPHKANTSQQLSTSFTNNANSSQQLEDALATLSNQSQSLLRTMRLDVVVLGSQNEDMKQTVCQLESQWDMLQRMVIEENERKAILLEAEEEGGETKEKGDTTNNNKKIESSIDWDGNEKRKRLEKRESISKQNNFDWGISDEEVEEKGDAQGTTTNNSSDIENATEDQETSDQTNDYGNDKPWLLRLFGRKDRDRETDIQRQPSEGNNKSIDDGNTQQEESQPAAQDSVGGLQKFFSGRRNSFQKQNTSVAGETLETYPTQQSESPSNAAGSSSNPTADNNSDEQDEEEDAELIQALQVKLKGCDSAVTTLKQLLQFQTSNLYDLQYQHTNLTSETKFNNKYNSTELKKLADQLHFAKVERRRKARQLEDVKKKKKIITSQEEQLRGEVVSIQTELFRLRTEINKNEQLIHTVGENGSEHQQQQHQRDSRHDRVVIVAGNHNGGSGGEINVRNRNVQTQWKNTRGILKNSFGGRTHPDAS